MRFLYANSCVVLKVRQKIKITEKEKEGKVSIKQSQIGECSFTIDYEITAGWSEGKSGTLIQAWFVAQLKSSTVEAQTHLCVSILPGSESGAERLCVAASQTAVCWHCRT